MKLITLLLGILLSGIAPLTCSAGQITPRPLKAEQLKGSMRIAGISIKCDPSIDSVSLEAVRRFAADLSLACGKTSTVSSPIGLGSSVTNGTAKGMVFLKDSSLDDEEYSISIDHKLAVITASDTRGFIYSLQTLRQLVPEDLVGNAAAGPGKWQMPCCIIQDKPQYGYRGLMLDCSRHFWTTGEIKHCLDLMEEFKLNRFHWHLTDDQGWRVEISGLPMLTQIASWREGTEIPGDPGSSDHVRYGGFYTQDEIKEIVGYAAARGIEVIPEISIPGHFLAALSAYPNIGCTMGPYNAATGWGVSDQLICAGKDESYEFLETVLSEVSSLFPCRYINIGMADCLTSQWERCPDCQSRIAALGLKDDASGTAEQKLLSYFLGRVTEMLADKGKNAVCREEVLDWADPESLKGKGTVIICSYGSSRIPDAIGNGVQIVISFDGKDIPAEDSVSQTGRNNLLGFQQDIWTEYISSPEQLEDTILPALGRISEIQWENGEKTVTSD